MAHGVKTCYLGAMSHGADSGSKFGNMFSRSSNVIFFKKGQM
jgi:hypothetical protein